MWSRIRFPGGRIASAFLLTSACLPAATADEIRSILANRVDEGKKAVGMVVGTVDEKGREAIGYGKVALSRPDRPDGDTLFEIGSITKVFTSLLLADMVERGEVKLDDPVAKYLPATVKMPERGGRQITLLDLSMQVSGLPRLPENLKPANPANPYADYNAARLYDFLSHYALTRDIGEKYEYSNLGAGLLGHALALRAGKSFEQLLRERIFAPLDMKSTAITLSESQKKRLATGHSAGLQPVSNWDMDVLAGAGAIRSTANDMLAFLAANLELTDTPLKAAMRRMRSLRRPTGMPDTDIAMAWHINTKFGADVFWHNGGTFGYRSFAGFDPARKKAVVVLCNTFLDSDDVGFHVLDARYPVARLVAPEARKVIAVSPAVLAGYVGDYEFAPGAGVRIALEEGRLFVQVTGQPRFELFAEKENEFFLKEVEAQVSFVKDASGAVNALVVHQNGREVKAARVKPPAQ